MIRIQKVDHKNWKDFESFFESRGSPHFCWCMVWRPKKGTLNKSEKKSYMKNSVQSGTPVGLLAYVNGTPAGWCSVAPRDTYRNLGGTEINGIVWSLVCFFIKREYRGRGMSKMLIEEAKKYAKQNGADYLEAYPVLPPSQSYRFMGSVPMFEQMGFTFKKMAGTKRHVMIFKL